MGSKCGFGQRMFFQGLFFVHMVFDPFHLIRFLLVHHGADGFVDGTDLIAFFVEMEIEHRVFYVDLHRGGGD